LRALLPDEQRFHARSSEQRAPTDSAAAHVRSRRPLRRPESRSSTRSSLLPVKRLLALLLVGLVVLLVWIVSEDPTSESAGSTREPASIAVERAPSRLAAPEPLAVAPDAAPARESADRVEIAPAAVPSEARLTLLGVVRDARGRAIENFGIRGIRKDASNAFAEERVWDVAFHAGGEFALVDLEPHAWELAPFADGYTLERSERFVRSNARAVVFRMKSQVVISGVVIDSTGLPIAGAEVRAKEQSARDNFPATWETTSDRAGRFQLTLDVGEIHAPRSLRRLRGRRRAAH
jgi:hypothetical protein